MTIAHAEDGTAIARIDASPEDWLVGGGEMAKAFKAMDWSKTPLGPMASWPQSLRPTVSLRPAPHPPQAREVGPVGAWARLTVVRGLCGQGGVGPSRNLEPSLALI